MGQRVDNVTPIGQDKRFVLTQDETRKRIDAQLQSRYRKERRFRAYGVASIVVGVAFLGFLFATIIGNGVGAFRQSHVLLDISFDETVIDPEGSRDEQVLKSANYSKLIQNSLLERFPEASGRRDRRALKTLVSTGAAFELRDAVLRDAAIIGTTKSMWLLADDEFDRVAGGSSNGRRPSGLNSVLQEAPALSVDQSGL